MLDTNSNTNQNSNPWYYKIVYFFVANQTIFKRLEVVLLLLANIIIFWNVGVAGVKYLASSRTYDEMLSSLFNDNFDWQSYHQEHAPDPLQVISVDKIKTGPDKYDLVAKVHNPNSDWYFPEVQYSFVVNNFITDWQTDFILPGQEKYFFVFSYSDPTEIKDLDLKFGTQQRQRIFNKDPLYILNDFNIQDKNFSSQSGLSEIKFQVNNNSYFSFWQLGWQVVLYVRDHPIGINYVTTPNFLSGQERQVAVIWNENLTVPTDIEILPNLDVFYEQNYMTNLDVQPVNLIRGVHTSR